MDDEKLPEGFRALGARAIEEAAARGTSIVEVEHILLAMTTGPHSTARKLLSDFNVDYARINTALDQERARSLAYAGIAPVDAASLISTTRNTRPTWGASVRSAMAHARRTNPKGRKRGDFDLTILDSVLSLELGTVPRALELAGIDRTAIRERIAAAT